MHLIELLIRRNQLSGRRSITPLGFVIIGIVLVFVGALSVGWFRQITRNVSALDISQTVSFAESAEAAVPTATPLRPSSAPHTNSSAREWPLQTVHTPLGEDAYVAPREVSAAVLRDYYDTIQDWDAHKYDLAYLQKHASDYFSGKQLERIRSLLDWLKQENQTVELGGYMLLPAGHSVQFAPNGMQAFVIEYIAAGKTYGYNLKTQAKMDEQEMPDRIIMTEMSYDAAAKRWKISRLALSMDLKTKQVLWQDQ